MSNNQLIKCVKYGLLNVSQAVSVNNALVKPYSMEPDYFEVIKPVGRILKIRECYKRKAYKANYPEHLRRSIQEFRKSNSTRHKLFAEMLSFKTFIKTPPTGGNSDPKYLIHYYVTGRSKFYKSYNYLMQLRAMCKYVIYIQPYNKPLSYKIRQNFLKRKKENYQLHRE